jgi:hypothetical protein
MTPNSRALDAPHRASAASRTVIAGLSALVWSPACPSPASASFLSAEAEDKVATFIAVFVLFVVPVVLITLFWMVHVMPEKIAHKRHHPQLEAIRTLCLLSLPAIALTTGVSSISSDLFLLKSRDNPVWNLGASLLAPIYRGGALKTTVDIRTAEQKGAIADYAAVGLRAFGEVEGALAAEIAAREREQILAQSLSDSQQALTVVQTQFKVGSTDLRFVEQRQLALGATRSALIRVQAEQRVQRVNLHLALGGSFELPPPPSPAPQSGAPRSK